MKPPSLKDDCFALPEGVNWTPVDEALALLKARLNCVVGKETLPVAEVAGRVAAAEIHARRANPPTANSAVDGFGFSFASMGDGQQTFALLKGRSAAGAPYDGAVPPGSVIRILTGAQLPNGVDSVVMQEDVSVGDGAISFQAGLKRRANARDAGEDVKKGAGLFATGHRFSPPDLALLVATGLGEVEV